MSERPAWMDRQWPQGRQAPLIWSDDKVREVRKRAGAVLADTPRQEQDGRTAELREMAEHAFLLAGGFLWALEGWRREQDVLAAGRRYVAVLEKAVGTPRSRRQPMNERTERE